MDDWGQWNLDEKTIYLNIKCLDDENLFYWTLIHEILHAFFEMSGVAFMDQNDEEAYVRCMENLFLPWLLKQNKIVEQLSRKKN